MFWFRFGRFDRMLVIGAVVVLLLSTALILDDRWLFKFLSTTEADLERIGQVKTAVHDVRRRYGNAFSWLPLDEHVEVFQGDSIFTGDKSEALILTDRGEQISISPNSLVVINAKTDSIRLDINYGSVLGQVGKDKKLVIASGGDVTEFKGENAVVKVDVGRDKNLVVNVLEGQVEVTSDEGTRTLGPKEQAQISEEGAVVDINDIHIDLLSPVVDRILKPSEVHELILTWKSDYNFSEYNLDIARDREFTDLLVTEKTSQTIYRPTGLPTNERLFWRISGRIKGNGDVAMSAINSFTIAEDRPPRLIFPPDRARLNFEEQSGDDGRVLTVVARWQALSASTKWEVQLAHVPDFSNELKVYQTYDTSINLGELSEGNYYWRVRAKDWSEAQWSESREFSIWRKPPATLKPPQVKPANAEFLLQTKTGTFTNEELRNPAPEKMAEYLEAIPELAWNPIPGAITYDIEIGTSRSFGSVILRAEVPTTRYAWVSPTLGDYYWRIRSVSSGGQRGSFTSPQPLHVKLAPPKSATDEKIREEVTVLTQMESAPPPFLIQWMPTLYAFRYELQFDKNSQFTKPLRVLTPYSFKKVQAAQAGTYFWRVRALAADNKPLSNWSSPYPYEYTRTYLNPETSKELKALFPNNETLMLIGEGEMKVHFHWVAPVQSGRYRLQLSSSKDFDPLILDFLTEKDFFLLRKKMPDGWYYWRLRVESPRFTSPWTTAYQFQIKHERAVFNFERSEQIQEEEIRRLQAKRQKELQEERKKSLAEESARAAYELSRLPLLETPANPHGPETFMVTMGFLPARVTHPESLPLHDQIPMVGDKPLLEWQPVAEAREYKLEIAQDKEFKNKISSHLIDRSVFRWTGVRPGRSYWRVTAQAPDYRPSVPSEPIAIDVVVKPPRLIGPHAALGETRGNQSSIVLNWTSAIFARGYELEWSSVPDFNTKVTYKSDHSGIRLAVAQPGSYFWRVRAVTEEGKPLTAFTDPRPMNIGFLARTPAEAPDRPVLLYPEQLSQLIVPAGENSIVEFSWKSPAKTGAHVIEVAKDRDFHDIIYRNSTTSEKHAATLPVSTGLLHWRLKISVSGVLRWQSQSRSFTLVPRKLRETASDKKVPAQELPPDSF